MELENNFKATKKQLELAIWQKSLQAIQDCKLQLETFVNTNSELSDECKTQANDILKKADELCTSLTPTDADLQAAHPLKQEEKKLSLRSRARQSHFKFMHQSKPESSKPLLSQMFPVKPENSAASTLKKRRSSIHRSLTFIDLPETHHRHDDEEEVLRDELEGHVICMCLSRLHEVLNVPNAKLINKIVNSLSNDKLSSSKQKVSDQQLISLRKMFNELDVDGSGAIDKPELKSFLEKLGHQVSEDFVNKLFNEMDINGDGSINFVEFMSKSPSWLLENKIQTSISMNVIKDYLSQHLPTTSSSNSEEMAWKYLVHWSSMQGKRNTFEDRVVFFPYLNELLGLPCNETINFAAIFDGHNGDMAAEYSSDHLYINILRNENFVNKNYKQAIYEGFVGTDVRMRSKGDKAGTTATVVLIIGDHLYCANVGDTKGFLYSGGNPITMTKDHVASDEAEKERIAKAGGMVVWFSGGWRVNGQMAVSRSIGDSLYNDLLIAEPHIYEKKIEQEDEFVILASDGLWDVCTPEKACEFVKDWYQTWKQKDHSVKLSASGEENISNNVSAALADWAFKETKASDNVTILVMFLKEEGKGERKDKAETICN